MINVEYRAYCRDGSSKSKFKNDEVVTFEFIPEKGSKITLEVEDGFTFYRRIFKDFTDKTINIQYFFGPPLTPIMFDSLSGEYKISKDRLRENGNINT